MFIAHGGRLNKRVQSSHKVKHPPAYVGLKRHMQAKEFYADQPPKRIIGTECEYNLQNTVECNGRTIQLHEYIGEEATAAAGLHRTYNFLSNGGKLGLDVEHVEYSTAEALGPQQALVSDTAGKIVAARVIEASGYPHRGLFRTSGTFLDVPDGVNNINEKTSGYHENYLIPRDLTESLTSNSVMATFLATRVMSMSGMVRNGKYVYSQKMSGIGGPVVMGYNRRACNGDKFMAIIPDSQKDKDTINDDQWARLEVICGDPSQAPLSRFLAFGSTSLVLRMLEHQELYGDRLQDISLARPVEDAHTIDGDDPNLDNTYETVKGNKLSVLDIQEAFVEYAYELMEEIDLPKDEINAINLWGETNDLLRRNRINPAKMGNELPKRLEIAARFAYLSRKARDNDYDLSSPEIAQFNLGWDCISPKGGSMQWWDRIGTSLMTQDEVERLTRLPPTNTRAAIRGRFVADHNSSDIAAISWGTINLNNKMVSLRDPYEAD